MDPSEGCREFIELLAFVRQDVLSDLLKDDEKYHLRLQEYSKRITSIERVKDEHLYTLAHSLCLRALLAYSVYFLQNAPEIRLRNDSNQSRISYIRKTEFFISYSR